MPSLASRPSPRLLASLLLCAVVAIGLGPTTHSRADTEQGLSSAIAGQKAQERTLGGAISRLDRLAAHTQKSLTLLEGRLTEAQSEFSTAQTQLLSTRTSLRAARARVLRLRTQLRVAQTSLSQLLQARYEDDPPDLVTVVLHANGFSRLLETLDFAKRVQDRDADVLGQVRSARVDANAEQAKLVTLEAAQTEETDALQQRRDQAAQLESAVAAREASLQQARTARADALAAVQASRHADEGKLSRLKAKLAREALARLDAQERAEVTQIGPGGPWAIPWAVVQCESGGQDLHPNYATASGYYQFLDSTWRGLGGSTPHAYQASKDEQDRLAARLWDGGRGARNWVCASIVGIV